MTVLIGASAILVVVVIVMYGRTAGEPQGPVAPAQVLVQDSGKRLHIALAHCPPFDIRQISVSSAPVHDALLSEDVSVLWRYEPPDPHQWKFDTENAGKGVKVPFAGLPGPGTALWVDIQYDPDTAPRAFRHDNSAVRFFKPVQTTAERTAYARLVATNCSKKDVG